MKKVSGIWVFASIIVIVAIPILYSQLYKNLSYITIKNAFVTAEVVAISPSYVSGMITKLYVKRGDRVKKGQIIALIDDTLYKAEVEKKRSKLNNILSKIKTVDNESYLYTNLKDEANFLAKDVKLSELMLSYTRITSPINGVIAKDAAHVGDIVSPNNTIVYIYKPNTLHIKAYILPSLLEYIKKGKKVTIYEPMTNKKFKGIVESVGDIGVFSVCNISPLIPISINISKKTDLYFSEPVYIITKK